METAKSTVRIAWSTLLRRIGGALLSLPAWLAWALPLGWMGFIWFLSSQSMPTTAQRLSPWAFIGNLTHAPLFGLLALFCVGALMRSRRTLEDSRELDGRDAPSLPAPVRRLPRLTGGVACAVMLVAILYGLTDEWHQSKTGGRESSLSDVLTDVVGAGCVLWIVSYLGTPRAHERGLRRRLLIGIGLCSVVAFVGLLV